MRPSRRRLILWFKIIAAVFLFLICACIGIELWAKSYSSDCWQYQQTDHDLGWSFKPNSASNALIAGDNGWFYKQEMRINSRGLRDREFKIPKPPDVKRILVLGDSFVECAQFPLEKTYLKLLENEVSRAPGGGPCEVLNGGHGTYGTDQELIFYQRDARIYDPDIVLLMMFPANDFADADIALNDVAPMPKYFFDVREDGSLARSAEPLVPPRVDELRENRPLADRLFQKTWTYPLFKSYTRRYHRDGSYFLESMHIFEPIASYHPEGYPIMFEIMRLPLADRWVKAGERGAKLAARLKREVEADGARFEIVIVPFHTTMAEAYGEDHSPMARWVPDDKVDLAAPEKLARASLEREGLGYFDLSKPLLESIGTTGKAVNLRRDGHFNEHGHEVVASLLFEDLRTKGLVGKDSPAEAGSNP